MICQQTQEFFYILNQVTSPLERGTLSYLLESCHSFVYALVCCACNIDIDWDAMSLEHFGPASATWGPVRSLAFFLPKTSLEGCRDTRRARTANAIGHLTKALAATFRSSLSRPRCQTHEAMRSGGLATAARVCLRPSRFSHQFPVRVQLPSRRHISADHGAPKSIARLLNWKPEAEARGVVVNGFIRSVRAMKARTFVALGDGSSLAPLQALVPTNQAEGYAPTLQYRISATVFTADSVFPTASLLVLPSG